MAHNEEEFQIAPLKSTGYLASYDLTIRHRSPIQQHADREHTGAYVVQIVCYQNHADNNSYGGLEIESGFPAAE